MKTKYITIYEDIKNKIKENGHPPGTPIPDEKTLCETYDCSRLTVRKALALLADEGVIFRKPGQGNFTRLPALSGDYIEIAERDISGFTKSTKGHGSVKLLDFQLIFAPKEVTEKLCVDANEPLYDILRVHCYDGEPIVLDHTYMPPRVVPGITEEILNNSVYTYIEKDLGKQIASAYKVSWADRSNSQDQEILGLNECEPVLVVEQIAYLADGTPFEYSISRHRYDKFRFSQYFLRRVPQ